MNGGTKRGYRFLFYKGVHSEISNFKDLQYAKNGTLLSRVIAFHSMPDIMSVDILVVEGESIVRDSELQMHGPAIMIGRYSPGNIMHSLHDEGFNTYHTLIRYYSRPLRKDVSIILVGDTKLTDNIVILQILTEELILHVDELQQSQGNRRLLMKNVILGAGDQTSWYQYGLDKQPQSQIPNKTVEGSKIKEVVEYIRNSLVENRGIFHVPSLQPLSDGKREATYVGPQQGPTIVLLSRTKDRRIVNEAELISALERALPSLPVTIVRLESMSLQLVISIISRAILIIGMHGSGLIFGAFMPKHSAMIEMYPYLVSSSIATPYRVMCGLPGMDIRYEAWENKLESNNQAFPDRDPWHGGIRYLSEAIQADIVKSPVTPHLCCSDPKWLYRIYQDTRVDVEAIVTIAKRLAMTIDQK